MPCPWREVAPMFDSITLGNWWEWDAPDPEVVTWFRRIGPDSYQNAAAGVPLLAIRKPELSGKEDDLGLVEGPNYGSDWCIYLDWLTAANLPTPKLDDGFVDANGGGWSVVEVAVKLRQQVVELRRCCSMATPFPWNL